MTGNAEVTRQFTDLTAARQAVKAMTAAGFTLAHVRAGGCWEDGQGRDFWFARTDIELQTRGGIRFEDGGRTYHGLKPSAFDMRPGYLVVTMFSLDWS